MGQVSPATRHIVCILNCSAGSEAAREMRAKLSKLLVGQCARATVVAAERGGDISLLAKQALKDGASVVVAAGGDGTVNGVASALVGAKAVLGVLPMGTLNHFAKDLGIPLDLEAAVANLFTGTTVRVDVGEVNGKRFLNNSSIGLYPAIVRQRDDNQTRGHSKWIAFAAATFYVLRRYSPLYVSLQAKGKPGVEEETPFVFVGNNQYKVSGLNIGERACLNAGRLWVYRAPRATRLALLRLALHAFRGWHDPGELEVVDVGELEIQTRKKRLHVSTDGEVGTFTSPLEYRILPKAISVIVPAATCVHSGN